MLAWLLEFSLRQRAAIFLGVAAMVGIGLDAAWKLPMDAVPDITSPQVQINTATTALAPEEIEKLVSVPIETAMSGLPDMIELRSLSKFGLSQVTMIFGDHVDLSRARQQVAERLHALGEALPRGLTPNLAPVTTGLGDIFYYALDYAPHASNKPATRPEQLMALKVVHDYQIRPLLRAVPGIADVNASGGYEKQFVVMPDPARLASAGLTVTDLADRLSQNTENAGGGMVEWGGEQIVIRANGRVASTADIAAIPLQFGGQARPLLVGDVAQIGLGSGFRTGASTVDGEETLIGATIMLAGANSRVVAQNVRSALQEIQTKIPPDLVLRPLYDRADLVHRTLDTVTRNLVEGAVLVVAILFLLLGHPVAAGIVALVIPLSMLVAVTGMTHWGVSGNLMSLGAIDFGLIIDGAVVMVENIVRHLAQRQHQLARRLTADERAETVLAAAREVARPMFFGVLIITVVYVPLLSLQGIEGKMFKPMAAVVMLALGGALLLALTLMPVLCAYALRGRIAEGDNAVVRSVKALYAPVLRSGLRIPKTLLGLVATAFLASLLLFAKLGAEFIPQLDEGDLMLQLIRSNSAGLDASLALQKKSEQVLRQHFPEIRELFSRIGTAEIALDPMGPNVADTFVLLHPSEQWRQVDGRRVTKEELGLRMRQVLAENVPGQACLISQPIELRFNEIMAGARADLVCKIYGDRFDELERLAGQVQHVLQSLPGGRESELDAIGRVPMLEIIPDRAALQRRNVHADAVNQVVATALGGREVGAIIEGHRRFPIIVRLPDAQRRDLAVMRNLPVRTADGGLLTLGQVASIQPTQQVATVTRENTQRRVSILINVHGRDTEGFVQEASRAIRAQVPFPDGAYFEFGGQYRNLVVARQRLAVVVPLALGLIFVFIYLSFGSLRQAALVFVSVPLAVTGGIVALWWRAMPFTLSAAVGFIALSGIAVLNGIMLITYINQLREHGATLHDAVVDGTLTRLRPKLMTALVASFGFVPMALAQGAGAEVQRPLATVVIGGIISSTFLTLIVLPVLYHWLEQRRTTSATPTSRSAP